MNEAYTKVLETIKTAQYIAIQNGTVKNLINNFTNMYNDKGLTKSLNKVYRQKLKEYQL
jgi:type V secretory pathway adhesin AidA